MHSRRFEQRVFYASWIVWLSLAGCELCDESNDCTGGFVPIAGDRADFSLDQDPPANATVREPRVCEDAYDEAHAIDVLVFGEETVDASRWMVDELRPLLAMRGVNSGWGFSDCYENTISIIVHDWGEAQEIGETTIELATEQDVTVSVHITVESMPIYCADSASACGI